MILELPITQEGPWFSISTELDGAAFKLSFRWNERLEQWVLDVADGDGNPIVSGIRVVIDQPLLNRFRGISGMPPGEIMAIDTENTGLDADLEDLGRRVALFYLSESELA